MSSRARVLLLGSGGREHTLAWKLSQSPLLDRLYVAPGNPGTEALGTNVSIPLSDLNGLAEFARQERIDLTVVGPEAPLVQGVVDRFQSAGLRIAGPSSSAARLEGSKVFTKEFLQRAGVPSAEFETFSSADAAETALKKGRFSFPTVVKADGLAAGKGVLICRDLEEAQAAVRTIMREKVFGAAGARLVVEEFLEGEETSFMVFSDGRNILPMVPSQDHKAVYEGDRGPNTGGMGAYSIDTLLTEAERRIILERIIEPTIGRMAEEGAPFRGVLYAGLMMTSTGPKVLEYNVRFGDPETQAVLPRLDSDLLELFLASTDNDGLERRSVTWNPEAAVCVVLASKGYPGSYNTGFEIAGIEEAEEIPETVIFHAGTARRGGRLVTAGGRVLGVTSKAADLASAIERVYEAVDRIQFQGLYCRRDIASKGLARISTEKGKSA